MLSFLAFLSIPPWISTQPSVLTHSQFLYFHHSTKEIRGREIIDGEVRKCQHALVPCANVIVVENSSLAFPTTCPQRQEQSCLSVTSHYIINACCSRGEFDVQIVEGWLFIRTLFKIFEFYAPKMQFLAVVSEILSLAQ